MAGACHLLGKAGLAAAACQRFVLGWQLPSLGGCPTPGGLQQVITHEARARFALTDEALSPLIPISPGGPEQDIVPSSLPGAGQTALGPGAPVVALAAAAAAAHMQLASVCRALIAWQLQ